MKKLPLNCILIVIVFAIYSQEHYTYSYWNLSDLNGKLALVIGISQGLVFYDGASYHFEELMSTEPHGAIDYWKEFYDAMSHNYQTTIPREIIEKIDNFYLIEENRVKSLAMAVTEILIEDLYKNDE